MNICLFTLYAYWRRWIPSSCILAGTCVRSIYMVYMVTHERNCSIYLVSTIPLPRGVYLAICWCGIFTSDWKYIKLVRITYSCIMQAIFKCRSLQFTSTLWVIVHIILVSSILSTLHEHNLIV